MHTDCSIHTGTSDARCVQVFKRYIYALHSRHSFAHFTAIRRQGFSKYNTPQTTLICSSSFTVFRRQESSKYKPPQTTPSMLRCFSPLSEVEDCWTTSVAQGSSRQATTTDTIHQSTIEITQWRDYCPSRILHGGGGHTNTDRPKTHDYIRFHRHKTHWEVTNQCHKSNHKLSCAPANQTTSLTLNQSSIAIVGTSM